MEPYYSDALTTIYHGECLAVMAELAPASFDAIICDPPYGTTACAWDSVIPFEPMWAQLKRLIKPRGAIVLFGSQPFTSALIMSNPQMFKYELIWNKERGNEPQMANIRPMKSHENMCVFAYGRTTYNPQKQPLSQADKRAPRGARLNRRDGSGLNIFSGSTNDEITVYTDRFPVSIVPCEFGNQNEKYHPTQKPLDLMEYLIKTYTNEGESVLDFTFGSGTTLRAAKNLKRHSVGIELLEQYCNAAVRRLAPTFEEPIRDATPVAALGPLFDL